MTGAGPTVRTIPPGDDRERLTCPDCGFIAYENPKMVAGSVVSVDGKIMLCRRAIEPRHGYWTLPAGYLELHETPEEGAKREAWEEARARIAIDALLAVYSVPRISQVQLIYRATLAEPGFEAGPESLEVALFDWADIHWEDLAFPSVKWALDEYRTHLGQDVFAPGVNPPGMTGDRF
ncbi:MAG TPA: NUDIX hydrolase [Alphaproteobacteria bacterium]|nr:NUDIX hydrolase [Alphaproteobacteria bacterium]